MFKYHLIVLVFWYEIRGYHVYAQTDTDIPLKQPEYFLPCPPASSLNSNKQNDTEESSKKSVTMNGNTNYHVGQQIFYIYDSQFFKRLILDNKDGSSVTSDSTGTHRFYPYKLTWNKARQACIQEGGHLAIINSDAEEKILSRILQEKNLNMAWLGLHDLYDEGDWVTILDQAILDTGYTRWTTKWENIPDNHGGGHPANCAIIIKDEGMDDVNCSNMHYFFCEIPA